MALAEDSKIIANVTVKIGGKEELEGDQKQKVLLRHGKNIVGMRIEKQMNAPNYFSVRVLMVEGSDIVFLDQSLEGKTVEILVGFEDQKGDPVAKGEISYIEPHFAHDAASSYLEIAGYDHSHRLTRGMLSKVWGEGFKQSETYSDVMSAVVSAAGLSLAKKDTPAFKVPYVAAYNSNPFQFARALGYNVGYVSDSKDRTDDKQVTFIKVDASKAPLLTVCRERPEGQSAVMAIRARFQMSTVRQFKEVEVHGWDPKKKQPIVQKVDKADVLVGEGTEGWKVAGKALEGSTSGGKTYYVTDQPVDSEGEAKAMAQAIFNRLSLDFLTGEVEIVGEPKVDIGEIVELKGFGKRFSGKYLVVGCTHTYYPDGEGYRTVINLARNKASDT